MSLLVPENGDDYVRIALGLATATARRWEPGRGFVQTSSIIDGELFVASVFWNSRTSVATSDYWSSELSRRPFVEKAPVSFVHGPIGEDPIDLGRQLMDHLRSEAIRADPTDLPLWCFVSNINAEPWIKMMNKLGEP